MENSLFVGELARRLGGKGATNTWDLVPGIFPTISLLDAEQLVVGPERCRAYSGAEITVPLLGTAEVWLYAKRPLTVRAVCGSYQIGTHSFYLLRSNVPESAPVAFNVDLAEISASSTLSAIQPSIRQAAGATVPIGNGRHLFVPVSIRLDPGESVHLCSQSWRSAPDRVLLGFEWEENPQGATEA